MKAKFPLATTTKGEMQHLQVIKDWASNQQDASVQAECHGAHRRATQKGEGVGPFLPCMPCLHVEDRCAMDWAGG